MGTGQLRSFILCTWAVMMFLHTKTMSQFSDDLPKHSMKRLKPFHAQLQTVGIHVTFPYRRLSVETECWLPFLCLWFIGEPRQLILFGAWESPSNRTSKMEKKNERGVEKDYIK